MNGKLLQSRTTIVFVGLLLLRPSRSLSSRAFATITSGSMTDKSGQSGKIWDRFADGYAKQPIADPAAYQNKLQVTQQYLKPFMQVLEIGCGTGGTSILHAPHVQHILATDISSKMLEIAKKNADQAGVTNVDFQQASIDELKIAEGSQDVVLGLSILHLLKNKQDAMTRVYKWLKPGGLFVTSTICAGEMGFATKLFIKTVMPVGQFFGVVPNFYMFTKEELKGSMRDAGFQIEYEWQPKGKKDAAVFIIGKK